MMQQANVQDIYNLSPMQQGMLFHTLCAPTSGVYLQQFSWTLKGDFDTSMLQQAWQQVMARHPILRTAFYWENLEQPYQVVYDQIDLPWEEQDWCQLSQTSQEEQLETFLKVDQERGFNLSEAPLMRLALIRLSEDTSQIVWSYHHLLLDGWSLSLVFKEVLSFYEALCQNQALNLKPPRPYRDYINWLQQQDLSQAEAFWRRSLKGIEVPTSLGVNQRSGNLGSQQEGHKKRQIKLSASSTAALNSFVQQHRLTLNTLVQGAWTLLLSIYSREEDVIFGTTTNGRPATIEGIESMVGMFLNTLPMRVQVNWGENLLSWLKKLQAQQLDMRQYEYSPLINIQEWSDVPRGLPLFESLVVFSNAPGFADSPEKARSVELHDYSEFEKTNYPLTVLAKPGSELSIEIYYDCCCFQDSSINRLLGHFRNLLEVMVTSSEQCLSNLSILTEEERQQLLVEWNDTLIDYPKDQCIHEIFEAQVKRTPDAVAVVFEGQQLTYHELNAKANQLACYLQKLGVKPERLVGICVERSVEMVVGLLGILKAGGAYVPLDPNYPAERLNYMLADSGIEVLLTQRSLSEFWLKEQVQEVHLDTGWGVMEQYGLEDFGSGVCSNNLAYVIYTSGSTGQPKGVAMHHASLVNLILWQLERSSAKYGTKTSQFAPISFDVSFQEIFSTWLSGGTLILVAEDTRRDGVALLKLLMQQGVERLFLPFVALEQLAQNANNTEFLLPNLCELITAGEQLRITQTLVNFFDKLPNCRLENQYGPTETHVATASALKGFPSSWPSLPSIGRPIANTQIYILDKCFKPVPIEVPGELYIAGTGLAKSYLNRPDLTSEKFLSNPFAGSEAKNQSLKIYKTGDLARYLPDGNIEFLGRIDHQVKIRGFRIEPGEIEALLSKNPAVLKTLVVARKDNSGNKRLVAYVVPKLDYQDSNGQIFHKLVPQLRSFVKEVLPEYMIPSAFVILKALPLTPNGKIDRKALPAPDTTRSPLEKEFVPPRTLTEELLAGIWSNVFGLDQVGIYDNFFDLGGHSLLAVRLISQVRSTFQIELPLRALFELPTVASLSERIETARKDMQGLQTLPLVPISRNQELQLSFNQERIWFIGKHVPPDHYFYSTPTVFRFKGALNIVALEQSFNVILQRHEALRTNFSVIDGQLKLTIVQPFNLTLSVLDLQDLPKDEKLARATQMAREDIRRPFDLASEPLLRTTVLQLEKSEYILLITVHQNAFDAWSRNVLLKELGILYKAFSAGKPSPLTELPIQYADFVHWQKQSLSKEVLETQMSYWKKRLAGSLPVLNLPTDYLRPPVKTFRGSTHFLTFSKELTRALRMLSQEEEVSMFIINLAAYQVLLYSYTSQDDLLIGTSADNRTRHELEGLIGSFLNFLVLRTDLSDNPSFRELLGRVRGVSLEIYNYLDMPFSRLVSALQAESDTSRTPLFQAMFVYKQFLEIPTVDSLGLDFTTLPFQYNWGTARCDLTLSLMDVGEKVTGFLEYSTDLFKAETISRMSEHFQNLLEKIVADPDQCLSDLRLIGKT
ncbi:MAG: amino acid adenylation domain-containing protein [Leptolyngbya sp. SIO1E4]|nr:amino acid adenylation domain-containing protein [Leptolyngbya sp. SIO1E4]